MAALQVGCKSCMQGVHMNNDTLTRISIQAVSQGHSAASLTRHLPIKSLCCICAVGHTLIGRVFTGEIVRQNVPEGHSYAGHPVPMTAWTLVETITLRLICSTSIKMELWCKEPHGVFEWSPSLPKSAPSATPSTPTPETVLKQTLRPHRWATSTVGV